MDKISQTIELVKTELSTVSVKLYEPLRDHTTFKIGGPVRAMYFPDNTDCVIRLCEIIHKQGLKPFIMGKGSNVLANDTAHEMIVINTVNLRNIKLTDTVITAECGVLLSDLAVYAYNHKLTRLEFAYGIPGTFGGAVVMNAGAYDREMKDVVIMTTVYNPEHGKRDVIGDEHGFSYRHSSFSHSGDVVLSSAISLKRGMKGFIRRRMRKLTTRRSDSQPLDWASAGSIFKRPSEGYAAALIDNAGLRGFSIGGAQVSEKHTGFIVNTGNATFSDVMNLIEHVQEVVDKRLGVKLELEVKVLR